MKLVNKLNNFLYKHLKGKGLGKFYFFDHLYKELTNRIRSDFAIVDDHLMFLDPMDSLDLSINHVYEEFETAITRALIKKGDSVVDVGANIGYYTLIYAKLSGEEGMIYAFEPDPNIFEILTKNVKLNGYQNVKLINKAVADKNDKLDFYLDHENRAANTIFKNKKFDEKIKVPTTTLDNYLKSLKVDLIKFDIQGAEFLAQKGMKNIIKNNKNIKIISEFWPWGISNCGGNAKNLLDVYRKSKFYIYELDENKKSLVQVTDEYLLKTYTIEKRNYTNLLLMR